MATSATPRNVKRRRCGGGRPGCSSSGQRLLPRAKTCALAGWAGRGKGGRGAHNADSSSAPLYEEQAAGSGAV